MDIFSLTQPSTSATSTALRPETILVVDDDDLHRSCLKEFLERRGYICLEATNGVHGLEILRNQSVSIIITDNNMPEMDGLTFIEEVKHEFSDEFLPIFLMTAEVSNSVRLRAFKNGVYRVFEKPLDFQEICYAVDWVAKFDLHAPLAKRSSAL
ncbi:MAG: response regulator [Nitrospirota bacterium]|nr:response regulator [Nitrospirota bacterium]MDH5585508.1 response regulator [Nitrospirota bacterium]